MSIYALFKCSPLVYNISMNKLRKQITKEQLIAYYILIGLGLIVAPNLGTILLWMSQLTTWFVRFIFAPFMMVFIPYSIYLEWQGQRGLTLAQKMSRHSTKMRYLYGKSGSKWHS